MPLYEYECAACKKVHEVMQKFSDAPLAECPECKGTVRKLISMGSFALKGSGWYTTDYKRASSNSKTAEKPAEKAAEKPAEKSAEKASSSAPAAASATAPRSAAPSS